MMPETGKEKWPLEDLFAYNVSHKPVSQSAAPRDEKSSV